MLKFNVRNQSISRIDNFRPAEKSIKYLLAQFDFKTEDWKETVKTAVFRNEKTGEPYDAILDEDTCVVPWEVLSESGVFEVSVYGIKDDGSRITTDIDVVNLNSTIYGGSATQDPSPTVYETLALGIDKLENKVGELEDKFENFEPSQPGGTGGNITVDSELSTESTNPVQNSVVANKFNDIDEDIEELSRKVEEGNVTSEKITTALGYTPANQEDVGQLSQEIDDFASPNDTHINLNDEIYQYGLFTANGYYNESYDYGFVTVNFIPVISGKTLEAYCTQKLPYGYFRIVEFDYKRKFVQSQNLAPRNTTSDKPISIVLSNDTRYIRVCIPSNSDIKDTVQLSVFYSENARNEYIPYDEMPEGSFVDYSRLLNVETNSVKIFSNVESMKHSVDLKEGAICETLGYYSENDGGGAKYIITSSSNTTIYQEELRNGLYATLMHDGTINVKQLGAYGNNSNDDTSAFQKAFDIATICVYIPEGKYKITSTILVSGKERFTVNAENSFILYHGTSEYCFKILKSWYCTFNFGYICASEGSGGCLEFYSADRADGEAYIDVHFKLFNARSNCVYIHADNDGFVNELRFYDGRVTNASDSITNGFKIESHSLNTTMDRYSFIRVGIEGVENGFYLIGQDNIEWNATRGFPQCINIADCRTCESFVKIIKTENTVRRIQLDTTVVLNPGYFDFSEKTNNSVIYGHFLHEEFGSEIATTTYVHNGKIIPFVKERVYYSTSVPEIDLTQRSDADSVFAMFDVHALNTLLKLSDVYGMRHGVNKFKINMLGKNANGFVIYDSNDNVICDGTNLNTGDIVEFEWYYNDILGSYWIATKMNTIPLITT